MDQTRLFRKVLEESITYKEKINTNLKRLFEVVFSEAIDEKPVYKGDDPNSLAAWLYTDISSTTDGRIRIEDKIGKFEWEQNKSNENINGKLKDGKDFSFYFSRYAYEDDRPYIDSSLSIGNHGAFLAQVLFGKLNDIFESVGIPDRLNPENRILLVIDDEIKEGSERTIIRATLSDKTRHRKLYSKNFVSLGPMNDYDKIYGTNKFNR